MKNILLVIEEKEKLIKLLQNLGFNDITLASSNAMAKQIMSLNKFYLCIIEAPHSDDFGQELAICAATHGSKVILIVDQNVEDKVYEAVKDYNIIVVANPINSNLLSRILKISLNGNCKARETGNGNQEKLQTNIEELKLIDRAKRILIRNLNMTEPQAHRYIEKQAMDLRITKKAVAQNVLKLYET